MRPVLIVWASCRYTHAAAQLPQFDDHKDPFDRFLVAQSLSEPLVLLRADGKLASWGTGAFGVKAESRGGTARVSPYTAKIFGQSKCWHLPRGQNWKEPVMATLTIRLPDAINARFKALAQARDVSMNRLFDEWATAALVQHGALTQCTARAERGDATVDLKLLDKLDRHVSNGTEST